MESDTDGYNRLTLGYERAMGRRDYVSARVAVRAIQAWLGTRSNTAQILPTGDVTGQAHYLLGWAARREAMLDGMIAYQLGS